MKSIIIALGASILISVGSCGGSSWDYRGHKASMIEELYQKAQSNSDKLEDLNDQFDDVLAEKQEVLSEPQKFKYSFERYWSDSKSYIRTLGDSTTQKMANRMVDDFKKEFEKSFQKVGGVMSELNELERDLIEAQKMLKLITAQSEMAKKQKTEMPSVDEMKLTVKKLEKLIKEIEQMNAQGQNP